MRGDAAKWILGAVTVCLALLLGWWIARDVRDRAAGADPGRSAAAPVPASRQFDAVNAPSKQATRPPRRERLSLEDLLLGLRNERLVRFKSDAAYEDFLRRLGQSKARLLGSIDRFRTVRVGFDNLDDLYDLLDDDSESFSNFLVAIPDLPEVGAQLGAVGFGNSTLEWLGISGDNSTWGSGVRMAILDTGVSDHPAFANSIAQIDLLPDGAEVPFHGHGTAVASLIIGDHRASPGIAPGTELLSIRIADDTGSSNSFLLAEGIALAVDQGAQVINISMGSYGDSVLVRDAVQYALDNKVLIVAAAGNEGLEIPAFPAAYEGVISVGSVDANGAHLDFSNTGESLDLSAPGYSVNAAWLDNQFVLFTGTSASAPISSAAIAATISEFRLSPEQAIELVYSNLNEAGAPGQDPAHGGGILNVGRVMDSDTAGIFDAALASNYFAPATAEDPVDRVYVTIENRGTEVLNNVQVEITLPEGSYPRTINSIRPGDIHIVDRPVLIPPEAESYLVQSAVRLPGNLSDSTPANDQLGTQIVLTPPAPEPDE